MNPLTATPEGTRVVVANYVCLAITLVVLVARAGTSIMWKRKMGLDDVFLLVAVCTGVTESVLTEYAVKRGLGTFIRPGNAAKYHEFAELVYASDLCYLVVTLFAKLSLVRLVYRVASPSIVSKSKLMVLQIFISVWALFAFPAIAFQCSASLPWLYIPDRCAGAGALWYPTLIFSILSDAWLAVCVWAAVPEMQIPGRQRQVVLGLFSTRFIVCLLSIVHLALLAPALKDLNQPRALPNPIVLRQLVMNASIVTAAIPALHKVFATYSPSPSATAAIYNPQAGEKPTRLNDIKHPESATLPSPKTFDVEANEITTHTPSLGNEAPTLGNQDFSSRLSMAFNKEIETKV